MPDEIIIAVDDNCVDDHVDEKIKGCIRSNKNFFMFAGAGSGKTRSLINALNFIADEKGTYLNLKCKQVAVITYTNAACDEILRRVGYNPLFAISTIHSFLWDLIKPYQRDIKSWVKSKIEADIAELHQKQAKARSKDYSGDIMKKQLRLTALESIARFNYYPNGENVGRDSLDHTEVISMGSAFICERQTMQKVLISKFPILFIDESQDTKKELVDALWVVEANHKNDFLLGMFGDTMQRIYMDGKENLATIVPAGWEHPAKVMNHRSTKRVIQLANAIRNTIDDQQQQARSDKSEGFVRLFVVPNTMNKDSVESKIYSRMAKISCDTLWEDSVERKILVLEHSMAANRLGFGKLNDKLKTFDQSFRDGTLIELSFLMKIIYPIVQAKQNSNDFAVMKILREHSPLLKRQNVKAINNQTALLQSIREKVNRITEMWSDDKIPTCIEIYQVLNEIGLFELPKRIDDVLGDDIEPNERVVALREGLGVSFSELVSYWNYVNDNTQFSTHQGIKGLEFDRVAVIMDDESAGGSLFSYDKLFGTKALSDTDKRNRIEGKDNTITRTMRLFYVTCTRAKESLLLVAYTSNTSAVKKTALDNGWFAENEILVFEEGD